MQTWQLFIRHAHRDTPLREADNGLSSKGIRQGEKLLTYLREDAPVQGVAARVLSSPKLRCRQTAQFAARWAGVEMEVDPRLDEQGPNEREANFLKRVEELYQWVLTQHRICLVSHGDLLPHLARLAGELGGADIRKGDLFWIIDRKVVGLNALHSSGIESR